MTPDAPTQVPMTRKLPGPASPEWRQRLKLGGEVSNRAPSSESRERWRIPAGVTLGEYRVCPHNRGPNARANG
jgi:hypothetical protein